MIELLQERPGAGLPLQGPADGRPGTRTRMTRVLVAGEHAERQRALRSRLRAARYDVTTARTGRDALTLTAHRLPDAVILDLSLPDIGGTEVIAKLRRWYQPPIIALSDQASPGDKIGALDAGADHYLTTPFTMDELMARLRAALRRDKGNVIHGQPNVIIGRWQVDLTAHRVTHADTAAPTDAAERLQLTPTEWAILEQLLQHPGQLVDGARLLTSVWGPGFADCTNYLRFHMTRLRRKLEDNPAHPRHLLTEHGMGYRYQPRGR